MERKKNKKQKGINKWLTGIIIALLLFILSLIFMPKTTFNDILYGIAHRIFSFQEKKIEKKEGEGKIIEKNIKSLEEQNKEKMKQIKKLKAQREEIKPIKNLEESKRGFAELGYPPK